MIPAIQQAVIKRGITRLCHFTPSRSLAHILAGGVGILPSKQLQEEDRPLFNPTDLDRLDGHTSHICCSIEYPNGWYMDRAKQAEILFRDWVVLFIKADYLSADGTLFCARNAASGSGANILAGFDAFNGMFASKVLGAYSKERRRAPLQLACTPTDDQAEVLIPENIPQSDVIGIGVASLEQAQAEQIRLTMCGINVSTLKFIVSPELFDKRGLSASIRAGQRPMERLWKA